MQWPELQKPFTGLHWWYRILTGTKWTFPYCGTADGRHYYWKCLVKNENINIECKFLNRINIIKMAINRFKNKVIRYLSR